MLVALGLSACAAPPDPPPAAETETPTDPVATLEEWRPAGPEFLRSYAGLWSEPELPVDSVFVRSDDGDGRTDVCLVLATADGTGLTAQMALIADATKRLEDVRVGRYGSDARCEPGGVGYVPPSEDAVPMTLSFAPPFVFTGLYEAESGVRVVDIYDGTTGVVKRVPGAQYALRVDAGHVELVSAEPAEDAPCDAYDARDVESDLIDEWTAYPVLRVTLNDAAPGVATDRTVCLPF